MKRKLRVCLLWHNLESNNFGVSALSISHISMLMEAAELVGIDLEVDTMGSAANSTSKVRLELEKQHGLRLRHINFSIRKLLRDAIKSKVSWLRLAYAYDLVLDLGEGDSFSDIYGWKRFSAHLLSKFICLIGMTPLIISPQTIGPFKSPLARAFASVVLKRAHLVYARDQSSARFAQELGADVQATADVAFSLPYEASSNSISSSDKLAGVNVSGLLLNGGYTGSNQFGLECDYESFCKNLVEGLLKRGFIVHLISHVICRDEKVEDDLRACKYIKSLFEDDVRVVVAPEFDTAITAKSYISGMNLFFGSRMHATIASLSSGVPTIPIAYSRKFAGVFGILGYDHTLDARKMTDEQLVAKALDIVDSDISSLVIDAKNALGESTKLNGEYVRSLKEVLENV